MSINQQVIGGRDGLRIAGNRKTTFFLEVRDPSFLTDPHLTAGTPCFPEGVLDMEPFNRPAMIRFVSMTSFDKIPRKSYES